MEYIEVDVVYYIDDLGFYWRIPHRMKSEYGQEPRHILPEYRYCWQREPKFKRFPSFGLCKGEFVQVQETVPQEEKWRYIYPFLIK